MTRNEFIANAVIKLMGVYGISKTYTKAVNKYADQEKIFPHTAIVKDAQIMAECLEKQNCAPWILSN